MRETIFDREHYGKVHIDNDAPMLRNPADEKLTFRNESNLARVFYTLYLQKIVYIHRILCRIYFRFFLS